jgi:hypothetical protein
MRLLIVGGMLALAVSASLTPAHAGVFYCDNVVCVCRSKCGGFRDPRSTPVKDECGFVISSFARESREHEDCERLVRWRLSACVARCGPIEGVEHLSQSALRARVKAKEAAQH